VPGKKGEGNMLEKKGKTRSLNIHLLPRWKDKRKQKTKKKPTQRGRKKKRELEEKKRLIKEVELNKTREKRATKPQI